MVRTTTAEFSVLVIPLIGYTTQYQLVLDQYGLNTYYAGLRNYSAFTLDQLVRLVLENVVLTTIHRLFPRRHLAYYVYWRDLAAVSITTKRRWWRTGVIPNRGTLRITEKSGKISPLFILPRETDPAQLQAAINQYRDKSSGSYGAGPSEPKPLANWHWVE